MKTTVLFETQSDFLTDFTAALIRLPEAAFGLTCRLLCSLARAGKRACRWLRSEKGEFALIIALALLILTLQFRSLL
ncbi:MAG: hypothetical protein HDS67_04065 [Bacteroidales bacterium]|nr:hypothetical protein [Bacteroidales bacterium]